MSLSQDQKLQFTESQKQTQTSSNADTAQTESKQHMLKDIDLDKKLSAALAEQYGCMSDSFRRY